jgi:hypothetical protein
MVSRQSGINLYAPGIDAACHGSGVLEAMPRKVRSSVQTPDTMMTDKNDLPIFRPFGNYFLHQLLSEKFSPFDVNSLPFFATANIDQWDLLTRPESFSDFTRGNLHIPIDILCGYDRRNDILHRKMVVPLANGSQTFIRTESAARTATNMVGLEKGSLSTRVLLEKLRHRCVGVDCSRHAHSSQRYIISPENQKARLLTQQNDSKL